MQNKLFRLTTVLVLTAFCGFVGCTKGGQPPSPPAPAPEKTASSETAVSEPQKPTPVPTSTSKEVTVYRDTWGVPHVFADTLAEAAYGVGYAQAEDRLDDIYLNVRIAIGRAAEVLGPDSVIQDMAMRLARNDTLVKKYWETAPPHLKALGDNFVKGVQAYLHDHPEKTSPYALELEGWHCAAVGRAMILRWPIGTAMGDLKNKKEAPPFGSNGWAVAPSRSAEGCAILLTDPHLTWEGLAVFYELRIHTNEADLSGFTIVGSPLIALGHNAHVAWACTTGGPDTSDAYMLKLNPENPMQYEYDGEWRTAQVENITINVKDAPPVQRMIAYTHLGVVFEPPDLEKGIAYAAASPYFEQTGLFEQMYRMNLAKNCDEFYQALGMNQFMEQNVIFADTEGNIQYVRVGATPIRPEGYNWSAPVPGNTSATAWKGIHDIADLVQIKNPAQGYMQNCNVSPEVMMPNSPMTPDKYPSYIYNVHWDTQNMRGKRILELLGTHDSITREQAIAFATDVHDIYAEAWQQALRVVSELDTSGKTHQPEMANAIQAILDWNGDYTKDSKGALLMRFWRMQCRENGVDCKAIDSGQPPDEKSQGVLIEALAKAIETIKTRYGRLDLTWGDVHRVGRSGRFYPCDGADYGGGVGAWETLFDVGTKEQSDKTYVANNGSIATQLIFLKKDGVESYTCTPWGQSADPQSPHHVDQAEKLYSSRILKPTWFKKEDLMNNVESKVVLSVP
ncbi:MAG TPA: penicillin acylase family protein [Candidatus Hydrogenedentes bacterium]|nr:penicillin acylase family protein [Candidatus Hydrogenedentota bacterium]HOL77592.1 penicillin acylase family protein [Candidatus Hydrogenedentota bacterium]HPO86717.1 penicillin acylase family protein [Candidatus Hydrogenedentota bacterium]